MADIHRNLIIYSSNFAEWYGLPDDPTASALVRAAHDILLVYRRVSTPESIVKLIVDTTKLYKEACGRYDIADVRTRAYKVMQESKFRPLVFESLPCNKSDVKKNPMPMFENEFKEKDMLNAARDMDVEWPALFVKHGRVPTKDALCATLLLESLDEEPTECFHKRDFIAFRQRALGYLEKYAALDKQHKAYVDSCDLLCEENLRALEWLRCVDSTVSKKLISNFFPSQSYTQSYIPASTMSF